MDKEGQRGERPGSLENQWGLENPGHVNPR